MKFLANLYRQLFLSARFFWTGGLIIALFVVSYSVPVLFPLAQAILAIFFVLCLADLFMLFPGSVHIIAQRSLSKVASNGIEQKVEITLLNKSNITFTISLIDELPYQLQIRDFCIPLTLSPHKRKKVRYKFRPTDRGDYLFGDILLYLKSKIGLFERKYRVSAQQEIHVYPSIVEMKKYEINTFATVSQFQGLKKIRKIGHSQEFDHIKEYVLGDDYQSINWKATSRTNKLMVNHYDDEKSQQVYCVIDKSRVMKLPFHGLSLLEYSINSSLVITNTILKKHDKAGVVTFSDKINRHLKADRTKNQLRKILDLLYNESTNYSESDYEKLYQYISNHIQLRSLLFLFTNFESDYSLERNIAILRKINKRHLLVVIFFENSEIRNYAEKTAESLEEIYNTTIAQKLIYEKSLITHKLQQHGIQTILTKPEDLSINVINKYLELKGKGLI